MGFKLSRQMMNKGFTLIEVLIAMTVFAMGMMGLMALQIISIRGTSLSSKATVAGSLAQMHMEKVINAEYHAPGLHDVNASNNSDLDSIANTDFQNTDAEGGSAGLDRYALALNIADNTPIQNTKTIVVLVHWDNGRHIRRLSTVKSLSSGARHSLLH
ncbi:MAG: prepilin-type N-terminal cleavage/methylation domain-containing protein [Desulfobacteraceae bacterium]|nr:MAG: prepilin-type N-terminal cleavage/methylation domain-containing protein [Desulfobacteraceae bacterium]